MIQLNKVGVLLRDESQQYPFEELAALLDQNAIQAVFLSWDGDPPDDLDLIIAMGGDGTVLKALDVGSTVPVLAINFGTVGFLTAGDRSELTTIVARLIAGDYIVSERLVLHCTHPSGEIRAINEVIVRTSNRFCFVDVHVDGTKIRTIQGDGVVVGTPTGSTGFLLSAGAPIVMPDVRCLILDGIHEHNFTSRTLVVSPDSNIRLSISPKTRDPHVYLTADGRQVRDLKPGDELQITRSETSAKLIYFEPHYFFHNLSSKLDW